MVFKIQRWSPIYTCDCVIEQVVEYDDITGEPKSVDFLMMNTICDDHDHLRSTEFRADHQEKSKSVLDLIEQIKARNLKQVDDLIANEKSGWKRKQLLRAKETVIQHNSDITEEWAELVQPPHAFDEHIHNHIVSLQQQKK